MHSTFTIRRQTCEKKKPLTLKIHPHLDMIVKDLAVSAAVAVFITFLLHEDVEDLIFVTVKAERESEQNVIRSAMENPCLAITADGEGCDDRTCYSIATTATEAPTTTEAVTPADAAAPTSTVPTAPTATDATAPTTDAATTLYCKAGGDNYIVVTENYSTFDEDDQTLWLNVHAPLGFTPIQRLIASSVSVAVLTLFFMVMMIKQIKKEDEILNDSMEEGNESPVQEIPPQEIPVKEVKENHR